MLPLKESLIALGNRLLAPLETGALRGLDSVQPFPGPVFVVGPPRSGTTLVFQLLVSTFRLGYLTNLMAYVYGAPYLTGYLTNRFLTLHRPMGFHSRYGKVRGAGSPSEGQRFWRRWFKWEEEREVLRGDPSRLYRTVAALSRLYQAPVVFKDPNNSRRIPVLAEIFPQSLFIEVRREVLYTAQSILKGRIDQYQSKTAWMGQAPRGGVWLRSRPFWEQVVEQVLRIQEEVSEARRRVGSERFLAIEYSALCRAPARECRRVHSFLARQSCRVDWLREPPRRFRERKVRKVSERDWRRLQEYLRHRGSPATADSSPGGPPPSGAPFPPAAGKIPPLGESL